MSDAYLSFCAVSARGSFLLVAGLIAGACSGGDGGDPVQPDPCDRPPRVEVWGGTRPTFAWAPACGAHYLEVVDVTPGGDLQLMWFTGSPTDQGMAPPVRYPEPGPGQTGLQPQPLVSGRTYRVEISASRRTSSTCLMGCPTTTLWTVEATFVP